MTKKHLTEEEIQRMIASDPDAPELRDEQLAQMKPFSETFPALADEMRKSVGRPKARNPKEPVSIRLDHDVLARLKAQGPGWQTRVNDILKQAVGL